MYTGVQKIVEKLRSWVEVVTDILELVFEVLTSPKGLELLDELLTVLDLPDLFPEIDGLRADDVSPTRPPSDGQAKPSLGDILRAAGAVGVQQVDNDTLQPIDKKDRKHATLTDILTQR